MAGQNEDDGYFVCTPRQRIFSSGYEEAIETALRAVREEAREEAVRRGARGEILVTAEAVPITATVGQEAINSHELCLSTRVTATASGSAGF